MKAPHPAAASPVKLNARVWFEQGDTSLAGATEVALLSAIAETGSITQAAKAIGRSYKWAWDTVEAMNQLSPEPLVVRETGGKNGGGTRLTARGERLIEAYRAIEHAQQQFVTALSAGGDDFADCLSLMKKFAVRTSARNQLFGTVRALRRGEVNDEVELELSGGERLLAQLTHASSERLGLAEGVEVVALVKAGWVALVPPADAGSLAGYNLLPGVVRAVVAGHDECEVTVELSGGTSLCSLTSREQAETLALAPGVAVAAVISPSSVIIGVPM
ncbi:molybdate transport system regulatory protein [Crenobacter luteus]|uniref:TOBE domain-containing protein n=1 Tax=Crenobacter luteus TaxID=1452487 RepID=UPI001048D7DD|nr:TOBE domain-containing protein [Crenobacter luteus]TCP14857.1 molybdate transport system regulatory protein [Crenobacter luteus]